MKPKHRLLCLLLSVLLAVALLPCPAAAESADDPQRSAEGFTPILRFVVAGDVHVRDNNAYNSQDMLAAYIRTAYAYSDAQTDYNCLDGIFFTGDNTQNGKESEQRYFFRYLEENVREGTEIRAVMGNHEFFATGKYTPESLYQGQINFMEYSGYNSPDGHLVIKGYHFLFMSNDLYSAGVKFSDAKLAWLDAELEALTGEDARRPVFVFQHEPPVASVCGAIRRASDIKLADVLGKYPQAVDFSGHTHWGLTNPQCIWQDRFTALTTGSLAYLAIPITGHPVYGNMGTDLWQADATNKAFAGVAATDKRGGWTELKESALRSGGMYYIVEVDADHRLRILKYDIFTESLYGDPVILDSVGDPALFTMTRQREAAAKAPVFNIRATVRPIHTTPTEVLLSIPQATCITDPVQNYRIDVYRYGQQIDSIYRLADSFLGSATPETIVANVTGLDPDTEYTFRVYAVSSWAKSSIPLSLTVTTPPAPAKGSFSSDLTHAAA